MFYSNPFDMLPQVHPFVLSVMECFRAMFFALHATLELRKLNFDALWIQNVPNIPSTFDSVGNFSLGGTTRNYLTKIIGKLDPI
jgi:hypothetical protein